MAACKQRGLAVFYDRDKRTEWWGKNYAIEQRKVYASKTRFFVPFLSAEYIAKAVPMDEFGAALATAVQQGDGYMLPVMMDQSPIPAELLSPLIHYLRASDFTPEELADALAERVVADKAQPGSLQAVEHVAPLRRPVRLPKIVPATWSKFTELERIMERLTQGFNDTVQDLAAQGLTVTVRQGGDVLVVRIERAGTTIAGIDVRKGTNLGDDKITWHEGYQDFGGSSSFNGWATPIYDKESGTAALNVSDLNGFMRGSGNGILSYDDFFDLLWDKVIKQVEQHY